MAVQALFAAGQFNGTSKALLVVVIPNLFAGGAVNVFFPASAVSEQNAGKHQSYSTAMIALQIIVPGELLGFPFLDRFVPAQVLQRPGYVLIPV